MFRKGDIILPRERVAWPDRLNGLYHPAVVWNEEYVEEGDFHGIMLTHAPPNGRFNNIPMSEMHIEGGYDFTFNNTHFVNQLFIKFSAWGPFEKIGQLTAEGIAFIEEHLTVSEPIPFENYIEQVQ